MNYLIVSDIHGSLGAALKIVELNAFYQFEKIMILGDINYNGARNIVPDDYNPKKVTEILREYKDKLIIIRGNCDSRIDEVVFNIPFFDSLKVEINEINFYLTHGDLFTKDSFPLEKGDVYIQGHTHVYELEEEKGVYFLNPGSITLPKIHEDKTFMIFNDEKNIVSLYNVDNKLLKTIIINK